jgi:hypothetical protein
MMRARWRGKLLRMCSPPQTGRYGASLGEYVPGEIYPKHVEKWVKVIVGELEALVMPAPAQGEK